jgi:hypothetical protein
MATAPDLNDQTLLARPGDLDNTQALYELEDSELEFMSGQTGIKDRDQLKEHLVKVQKELYSVSSRIDLQN